MHHFADLAFLFSLLKYATSGCNFPSFVQNRGRTDNIWVAMYSYSEHLTTKFMGGVMSASHCKKLNTCHSFERTCQVDYGVDNVFLVSHKDSYNTPKFMCMQLLKRSLGVIQIKTSRQSERASRTLCYDMKLDSIPLISNKHYYDATTKCPIIGGFDVEMFDSDSTQLCPKSLIPIRLESECESGEGMFFKFRKKECIHQDLAMKPEQRVFCIAVWSDGPHTFMVIRDDSSFRTWCLRYTSDDNDSRGRIKAYLFMDFVCDPTEFITESTKYLFLELNRRVLNSLCVDEFPSCQKEKNFLCHSDIRPHCPLSCKLCDPLSKSHACEFDKNFHGTWMQSRRDGMRKIKITSKELYIGNEGQYQCVRFDNSSIKPSLGLLRIFKNGCYPRFMCGEFDRPAPSVLHYRLGNSVVWPIFHEKDPYSIICSEKSFHNILDSPHNVKPGNQYEIPQKSQTSVVNLDDERAVFCNLSVEFASKIAFVDQFNCSGCLSQESAGKADRLAVHYSNCSATPLYVEHLCFASFKSINTYDRLLTRTVGSLDQYSCWVFISVEKIIILPGSECSQYHAQRASKGELSPKDVLFLSPGNGTLCDAITPEPDVFSQVLPNTQFTSGNSGSELTCVIEAKCLILVLCVIFFMPT